MDEESASNESQLIRSDSEFEEAPAWIVARINRMNLDKNLNQSKEEIKKKELQSKVEQGSEQDEADAIVEEKYGSVVSDVANRR